MGNSFSPCLKPTTTRTARVVLWGGATRALATTSPAPVEELLREFPGHILCHGNSFYIGYPVPTLSVEDRLLPGEPYFLLPAQRLRCKVLSTASIAVLSAADQKGRALARSFGDVKLFEHVKTAEGDVVMRVSAKLLERISMLGSERECPTSTDGQMAVGGDGTSVLCSTRELRRHYEELVGWRAQRQWSPKLETISEGKSRWWWSSSPRSEPLARV